MTPTSPSPRQVEGLIRDLLQQTQGPAPDEGVRESIVAGTAAEAAAHSHRTRRFAVGGFAGIMSWFRIPALGYATAGLVLAAFLGTAVVATGVLRKPDPIAFATTTTVPAATTTTVPAATTTTVPAATTTTVPAATTTTVPATTTTTVPPGPVITVAADPICPDTSWTPVQMPRSTDKEAIVRVDGVTVDFQTRRTPGPGEVGVYGVESIYSPNVSKPTVVLWLRVDDLYYRVTAADLPWSIPLQLSTEPTLSVTSFGACLGE